MEISRVEFAQGGWLSGKRTYMRMMRERLALELCGPFWHRLFLLAADPIYSATHPALASLGAVLRFQCHCGFLIGPLGLTFAFIAEIGLMVALAAVMRNTVAMGLSDLDNLLLKLPVIGRSTNACFVRKPTTAWTPGFCISKPFLT